METMNTIDLLPTDPDHRPEGGARVLLYPLWVLEVALKPHFRADPRTLWFSVDAMRGIPLPIRGEPEGPLW